MALEGDLKSVSLTSLLQVVEVERKSGILHINAGPYHRHIFFQDGNLVFFISDDPQDLFGQYLINQGLIQEEHLAEALKLQAENQSLIGSLLSEVADIAEEAIQEKVKERMNEAIYQLFLLDHAKFKLEEMPLDLSQFPDIKAIPIQGLILEGVRRFDDYQRFKKEFPNLEQNFLVHRENLTNELNQNDVFSSLIDLLEKGETIHGLCLHLRAYESNVLFLINQLYEAKVLEKKENKNSKKAVNLNEQPHGVLMELARTAEKSGNWAKALEILKDLLKLEPQNEDLRHKFNEIQNRITDGVRDKGLTGDAKLVIVENVDLTQLKISTLEGFILSRINGTWTISEITSVVPSTEAEVLSSLKNLLDLKVIKVVK